MQVGIIGTGTVGTTIAIRLWQSGYHITYVASRTREKAEGLARRIGAKVAQIERVIEESKIVFITTPDQTIEPLVREFAAVFKPHHLVVHCSGALSSRILQPAREQGAKILSIHPLQSFASVELALQALQSTHFSIEGDEPEAGVEIVKALGGIPHIISPEGKILYHAGACFVSNYLAVLAEIGVKLLEMGGFKSEEALPSLIPLMQGSVDNLRNLGLPDALTGPVSRGDIGVVRNHLAELPAEYQEVYRLLGLRAAVIGEEKGTLRPDTKEQIDKLLTGDK
jgi:predicted short-subunit dehydrogenase-like oxidoreductase (DUF2520 family)